VIIGAVSGRGEAKPGGTAAEAGATPLAAQDTAEEHHTQLSISMRAQPSSFMVHDDLSYNAAQTMSQPSVSCCRRPAQGERPHPVPFTCVTVAWTSPRATPFPFVSLFIAFRPMLKPDFA
jgi:hypothetical protein